MTPTKGYSEDCLLCRAFTSSYALSILSPTFQTRDMKYSHVFDDTTYTGQLWTKFGASIVIFCVSLLGQWSWSYSSIEEKSNSRGTLIAVSFPALSKRVKYLRIPSLVFFLGKHFGTGVILSTAFVHLLTDAFKALNSDWTGLIVCVTSF